MSILLVVSSHDQMIVPIGRPSSRPRSTPKNAHVVFSRAYLRTRTDAQHAHVRRENLALHAPLPDFLRILLFPLAIGVFIQRDTLDKRHDTKTVDFSHKKMAFRYIYLICTTIHIFKHINH